MAVVGKSGAAAVVGDLAQAADAAAAGAIPGPGLVLAGGGELGGERSVEGVVGPGFDDTTVVGDGEQVASGIVGHGSRATVGRDFLSDVAQPIDGKAGDGVVGRLELGELALAVLGQDGLAVEGVGDLGRVAQGVILDGGAFAFGVGGRGRVAVGVVGVGGGVADGVAGGDFLIQATQCVEGGVVLFGRGAVGVAPFSARGVAHGVEGSDDSVAFAVGHAGQPVGGVVVVFDPGAVGVADFLKSAPSGVVVGGGVAAHPLALEPAARPVAQRGDDAVGVGHREESAILVIGGVLGDVAEGVLGRGQVAQGMRGRGVAVVGVGGDVGAWICFGEDLAKLVIGPFPGAGAAGYCCSNAAGTVFVRRGLLGLAAENANGLGAAVDAGHGGRGRGAVDAAVAVVDVGGKFLRFGDLGRQAPVAVPGGADGAGFWLAVHFDSLGFEVAGQVVGVGGLVAVEVGAGGDVAVGVVGLGARRGGAAAAAWLALIRYFGFAKDCG